MAFEATAGNGGGLIIDSSADVGGAELGPRPMELVLLALAGCTGMSVMSLLRRSVGQVVDYQVTAKGRQRETHPRIFSSIAVEHAICGQGITAGSVARAVTFAATRFCPVAAMLGEVAEITETWVLIDAASGDEVGRGEGDPSRALPFAGEGR